MLSGRSLTAAWWSVPAVRADRWIRMARRCRERASTSAWAGNVSGALLLLRYLLRRGPLEARLSALTTAARRITHPALRRPLALLLRPWLRPQAIAVWHTRRIGWTRYADDLKQAALTTSLVLKAPGPDGERGVLYCSFEYNWLRLAAHPGALRLLADYVLVGASSWSPPDYAAMASIAGVAPDPVFIGISNRADVKSYAVLAPRVRAAPIMASDWINPDWYAPRPAGERDLDILMVANFSRFKRHDLLFDALSRMRRDLRVALIGIPAPGRSEAVLRAEARAAGVLQDLEFVTNAPIETVTEYQCRAKTSVILSRREGSCVAVAESLFAGCPVAMPRHAHVGSKAYINPATGVLVGESRLDRALSAFVEASPSYRPREWALAHITCHDASRTLNALLRRFAESQRRPWRRDIAPMCWRYVPSYVDPADEARLAPEVERLRNDYGVVLEKFHYSPHPQA
jgi:glycosyltransferase involved in cell wall biosynthesis